MWLNYISTQYNLRETKTKGFEEFGSVVSNLAGEEEPALPVAVLVGGSSI